jgi:hypothetical protein
MSSTNRGYKKHVNDFYITPHKPIKDFFIKFFHIEKRLNLTALDPCCGGNENYPASYPYALMKGGFPDFDTIDIRENSKAKIKGDYLQIDCKNKYSFIISNPPFGLALEFIQKALNDVLQGGFVVMLLRLNFFGSQARKDFFDKNMPKYCFIHSKRISFFPEDLNLDGKIYKKGATDSIEYAHFVWEKGYNENYTKTYLI